MSCQSNGCKLARPGEGLNPLCFAGCKVELRKRAAPAPQPEPDLKQKQVDGVDSMMGGLTP